MHAEMANTWYNLSTRSGLSRTLNSLTNSHTLLVAAAHAPAMASLACLILQAWLNRTPRYLNSGLQAR